jgi:predicted Zn-dependent protease
MTMKVAKRGAFAAACFAVLFSVNSAVVKLESLSVKPKVIGQSLRLALVGAPSALNTDSEPAFAAADGTYLPDVCKQGMYHWSASHMPIKVFISNGADVPGYRSTFNGMIRDSFDRWSQASGSKISWKQVSDRNAADVTVDWTTQVKQLPQGTEAGETNALTRLNTATNQGIIYGARMHFLTQLNGEAFSDNEMFRTCLHEAGHALGLQGHSTDPQDVMYYAISKRQQPILSDRDRQTMATLYKNAPATDAITLNAK